MIKRINVLTEGLLSIDNQEVDVVEEMNLQLQDIFEEDSDDKDHVQVIELIYEIIETNSFIGLRSPKTSLELFLLSKLSPKEFQTNILRMRRGDGIVMGEHCVNGYYLDNVDESNRNIKKKCIVFDTYRWNICDKHWTIKTIINGYQWVSFTVWGVVLTIYTFVFL